MIRVREVKVKDSKGINRTGLAVDNDPKTEADYEAQQLAMQEHFKTLKIVSIEALKQLDAKQNNVCKAAAHPSPDAQYWAKLGEIEKYEAMPEFTATEAIAKEHKLEQLRAELAALETPAPTVADTTQEPQAAAVQPLPVSTVDRGWTLKRAALIAKHEHQWPTIARDLQDASDNQLSKVAKATGHGDWFEADALKWAEQRGKLSKVSDGVMPAQATLFTGLTHRIKG
jgi:hypothetical protein